MTKTMPGRRLLLCMLTALLLLSFVPLTAQAAEYTAQGATAFVFSDTGITVTPGDYTGYKISKTALTINQAGTYIVSGSCADGSITVKKGTTGVTLVLNGLTLTSADTAPLACNKSSGVTLVVASGTVNSLTDSANNNDENFPDNADAENAVVKCKDGSNVVICGAGTLNITANGKNGIKSGATTEEEGEASLTIREVTLNITAPVNDAVNAEQLLRIESGALTISAADDALHCDLEMQIGAAGTAGPTINITACYEGLEAATLNILSGNVSIVATDDCLNAANSDLTDYAFSMTISGGVITAYTSSGDGFDSNGSLTITGGTVTVWTANTADNQPLDADGTITITGGTVLAAGGSSGMGMTLNASQPCVIFGTAAGNGGMGGASGGQPGGQPGGQSGGQPGNPPGGQPGQSGQTGASAQIAKGSSLLIQDGAGTTLYSGTAVCDASYLFFSSAELTADSSYTLMADNTVVATAAAQSGTVSSGGGQPGNPSGGQPGGQPGQPGSQPEAGATTSPQTGDGASMGWCFVLAGSGAFAVLLWVLYRRIGRKKRVKTP